MDLAKSKDDMRETFKEEWKQLGLDDFGDVHPNPHTDFVLMQICLEQQRQINEIKKQCLYHRQI